MKLKKKYTTRRSFLTPPTFGARRHRPCNLVHLKNVQELLFGSCLVGSMRGDQTEDCLGRFEKVQLYDRSAWDNPA